MTDDRRLRWLMIVVVVVIVVGMGLSMVRFGV